MCTVVFASAFLLRIAFQIINVHLKENYLVTFVPKHLLVVLKLLYVDYLLSKFQKNHSG